MKHMSQVYESKKRVLLCVPMPMFRLMGFYEKEGYLFGAEESLVSLMGVLGQDYYVQKSTFIQNANILLANFPRLVGGGMGLNFLGWSSNVV